VATGSTGPRATLRVANSGPVVAPGHVAFLFEPFRRGGADRTRTDGGSGLGLSIVRSVVEAHRGQLETTAPASGGLEITVSLPIAEGVGTSKKFAGWQAVAFDHSLST
jgi:signal transduction histidine kinase